MKEKLAQGYKANGKEWRVKLDGYNFLPFFKGEANKGPRDAIYYFSQGGELNAVRWNDWKVAADSFSGVGVLGEQVRRGKFTRCKA